MLTLHLINFSCTADVVRGAYPIPISNRIGSLSFLQIFPIFGMNVHNTVGKIPIQLEFLNFASNFLWIFNYKKLEMFQVFDHRFPQFSSDLSDIWFDCAQQYCPQNYWTRTSIFLLLFFQWIFSYKSMSKLGIFEVFCHFLITILMPDPEI